METGEHLALVKGNVSKGGPVLVRVHALNVLHDVLGIDGHTESGTVIEQSMRAIEAEGRGVLVLIRDLRPKSVSDWVTRRNTPGALADLSKERRQVEIGVGSQILADLGVKDMVLLTTQPQHVYVGLEAFGLRVTGTEKSSSTTHDSEIARSTAGRKERGSNSRAYSFHRSALLR